MHATGFMGFSISLFFILNRSNCLSCDWFKTRTRWDSCFDPRGNWIQSYCQVWKSRDASSIFPWNQGSNHVKYRWLKMHSDHPRDFNASVLSLATWKFYLLIGQAWRREMDFLFWRSVLIMNYVENSRIQPVMHVSSLMYFFLYLLPDYIYELNDYPKTYNYLILLVMRSLKEWNGTTIYQVFVDTFLVWKSWKIVYCLSCGILG